MVTGMEITNGYRIDDVDVDLLNDTAMKLSIEQRITGKGGVRASILKPFCICIENQQI